MAGQVNQGLTPAPSHPHEDIGWFIQVSKRARFYEILQHMCGTQLWDSHDLGGGESQKHMHTVLSQGPGLEIKHGGVIVNAGKPGCAAQTI